MKRIKRKKRKKIPKVYTQVASARNELLTGRVLVIDPSIGSAKIIRGKEVGSMPGYALFENGQFLEKGILDIKSMKRKGTVVPRLREISQILRAEFSEMYDVLIIEDVAPTWSGAGGIKAVAPLMKAMGCIIGTVQSKHVVEITPISWTSRVSKIEIEKQMKYIKGDDTDAEWIGYVVMQMAISE